MFVKYYNKIVPILKHEILKNMRTQVAELIDCSNLHLKNLLPVKEFKERLYRTENFTFWF